MNNKLDVNDLKEGNSIKIVWENDKGNLEELKGKFIGCNEKALWLHIYEDNKVKLYKVEACNYSKIVSLKRTRLDKELSEKINSFLKNENHKGGKEDLKKIETIIKSMGYSKQIDTADNNKVKYYKKIPIDNVKMEKERKKGYDMLYEGANNVVVVVNERATGVSIWMTPYYGGYKDKMIKFGSKENKRTKIVNKGNIEKTIKESILEIMKDYNKKSLAKSTGMTNGIGIENESIYLDI